MPPNLDSPPARSLPLTSPNFEQVLDAVPGIVYVVDEDFRIRAANRAWDTSAQKHGPEGVSRPDIIGKPLLDVIDDKALRIFYEQVMHSILQGEVEEYSQVIDAGPGQDEPEHLRLEIRPMRRAGEVRGLLFQITDYSAERRAQLELMEKDRKLLELETYADSCGRESQFFERLWRTVAWPGEPEEIYQQVLDDLCDVFGIEYGAVYVAQEGSLRMEASCGFFAEHAASLGLLTGGEVTLFDEPVIERFPFEKTVCSLTQRLEPLGVQALIAVPITCQGERYGMLFLASVNGGKFRKADLGLLKLTGSAVASVLRLQRTTQSLRAASEHQTQLAEISTEFSAHSTKPELLHQLIPRRLGEAAQAVMSVLYLADESEQTICATTHWNAPEVVDTLIGTDVGVMKMGESPGGICVMERKPMHFENLLQNDTYVPWSHFARELGYNSVWAFPLTVDNHIVGAVNLYYAEIAHPLEPELMGYLEVLAGRAAAALRLAQSGISDGEEATHSPVAILENLFAGGVSFSVRTPEGTAEYECQSTPNATDGADSRSWTLEIRQRPEDRPDRQSRYGDELNLMEKFADSLGHDFNDLLTGILGRASLLGDQLEPEHPSQTDVKGLIEAAEGASDLIQELVGFAHPERTTFHPLDFDSILSAALSEQAPLPNGIDPVCRCEVEDSKVLGDSLQMRRLLRHLITNACHALPDGGRIDVSAERVHVDETPPDALLSAKPGDYVRLRVRDDGVGIRSDHRAQVFEPFFSAWKHGRRPGLGLASVYAITQRHGGWLHLQSQEGEGTTVDIYLPVELTQIAPDNEEVSALHYQV